MDMRQLRYFVAVAEEMNFTRAAERLHITQPPLTRQIQALERSLGVELFARDSHGTALTEAGKALLHEARNIAALVEQTAERARLTGRGDAGRLDIGYFGTSAYGILPRIVAAFRQDHPNVKLVLHPGQTPAQVLALRQGRVAIVFERQVPQEPDIAVELAAQEPVMVALPAGHALARRKAVPVEALRGEPMVVPKGLPPHMSGMAVRIFQAHGLELNEGASCYDITSGTMLVACGAGVFLVPASMSQLQMPGVVYRPLKCRVETTFDFHCFYLRGHSSPLVDNLLRVVRSLRAGAREPAAARARSASSR